MPPHLIDLASDWELFLTADGSVSGPRQLGAGATRVSLPAQLSQVSDDEDAWLRRAFFIATAGLRRLRIARIGPLSALYLDGERIASTSNLFRSHVFEVELTAGDHELVIHLPSPARALAAKRPRPRWKTRLVAQQQLRYLRTPLLGRIPAWASDNPARGVLGGLSLTDASTVTRDDILVAATLEENRGVVRVGAPSWCHGGTLRVGVASAPLVRDDTGWRAEVVVRDPARWWPHTHGAQATLPMTLQLAEDTLQLGPVGFRTVEADRTGDRFQLRVNGVAVFCRGAVFVPRGLDLESTRTSLTALRDAGGNMVRIGGTMRYEDRAFFALCDELGLLVWQDFMFANMDYPILDPDFAAEVEAEVDEQLHLGSAHASLAVLCGGCVVAQQAAMVGQPPERWYGTLFESVLPSRCAALCPQVPYVLGSPSSASENDLPFRVDRGIAHYFGVGAYLLSFEDARRADVTFASECLALSNVPEPHAVDALFGDEPIATHTPRWKTGVPRDNGAGWDFEDVRDHYLRLLAGRDALTLRYADPEAYLELSRISSVEVMTRVFSEWRRSGSNTHGGLVWFLRDLVPGAGWGLLDVDGHAKSPLLALRRVWSPTALLLTDEGVNGLRLHVAHEGPSACALRLRVALYRSDGTLVAEAERTLTAAARSRTPYDVDTFLGGFRDVGFAYRFGPRAHDVLLATLHDERGTTIGEAAHLPQLPLTPPDADLRAEATRLDDTTVDVAIHAGRLAYYVCVRVPGWDADGGYFHIAPGGTRTVRLRASAAGTVARGFVHALGATPVRVSA